jgi:transcriptional regulator
MYIRSPHREENIPEILEFIRQNEFATLVTFDGENSVATHLLLGAELTAAGEVLLEGHMARANPQWKTFEKNSEVLAVFLGPHAYLSPTWYAKPDENVPTWNYVSAHLCGRLRIVEDKKELLALMQKLVAKYETDSGYRLENLPPDYLEKQLAGIVGFQIAVTKIQASFKLAQTLDRSSFENVIAELENRGDDNSRKIAEEMRKRRT